MDESEDNMSADDTIMGNSSSDVKVKPKKRSLVERELETSLTARVTSPINGGGSSTSRYGRSRRMKTDKDFYNTGDVIKVLKSPQYEITPVKSTSPAYKMHASNSPVKKESRELSLENNLESQIENIYNANISLSRFGSEDLQKLTLSPSKKFPKVYIRKDLIQTKEKEETVTLIKHMFSPVKSTHKTANSHLSNILERSSEKYNLNGISKQNGYLDTSSVVKALDFDSTKKKRRDGRESKAVLSKSDLFDMEAKCLYQVGGLAWARMGTYPFWPSIVTKEPGSEMFVKKKLFGKIERDMIHVTFLGDNGRRSWILDSMLRKFQGLAEFEAAKEQFTPEAKKKDPRLYAAFFISEKKEALWRASVKEAEILQKEPKRLRMDLLNELLLKQKVNNKIPSKSQNLKSGKITRTDSDVSLSESLYDTLFSEDDGKNDDVERSRIKTKNKSLDVSDVVTACLDNMAAKTGMTKIQKQSHMDRWLQKAKSKTPEKSQYNITVTVERVDKDQKETSKVKEKNSNSSKKKKKTLTKEVPIQKPYSFRKSVVDLVESRNLLSHHNEHDYSKIDKIETTSTQTENIDLNDGVIEMDKSICVIDKVESLCNKEAETTNTSENDLTVTKEQDTNNTSKVTVEQIDDEDDEIESPPIDSPVGRLNDEDERVDEIENPAINSPIEKPEERFNLESNDVSQSKSNNELEEMHASVNYPDLTINDVNDINLNDALTNCVNDKKNENHIKSTTVPDKICLENKMVVKDPGIASDTISIKINTDSDEKIKDLLESNLLNNEKLKNIEQKQNEIEPESCIGTNISIDEDVVDSERDKLPSDFNKDMGSSEEKSDKCHMQIDDINDNLALNVLLNVDKKENENQINDSLVANVPKISDKVESIINSDIEVNLINNDTVDINLRDKIAKSNIKEIPLSQLKLNDDSLNNTENDKPNFSTINIPVMETTNDTVKFYEVPIVNNLADMTPYTLGLIVKNEDNSKQFDSDSLSLNSLSSGISNASELLPKIVNVTSISKNVHSLLGRNVQEIKNEIRLESDNESMSSLDDITLSELKMRTKTKEQPIYICSSSENTMDSVKSSDRKLRLVLTDCLLEGNLPKIKDVSSKTGVEFEIADTTANDESMKSSMKRKLRLRKPNSPPKPAVSKDLVNGFCDSKEVSPERKEKVIEPDTVSINSIDSGASTKRKGKKQEYANMEEPEFRAYLELRQDPLMDEHPELTQDEIIAYLYKTWQYEESLKSEHKKNDDIEQSNLVKGANHVPPKKKKVIRPKKVINIDKVISKDSNKSVIQEDVKPRELPKRKSVKPYYNEDFSDIEEQIELFEIFKTANKQTPVKTEIKQEANDAVPSTSKEQSVVEAPKAEVSDVKEIIEIPEEEELAEVFCIGEEELYFEHLMKPKPNIFRGLAREKVCEICETTSNLVKCKGCNGMFHVDCTKKVTEVIEVPVPMRGRKKKKKPRGRKPKNSLESNDDSHSDEKSQDVNVSEENLSFEDIKEPDPIVIDNADSFEEQLAAKMQEIMGTVENIDYDSYASDDGLDWDKSVAGQCEIVDIKLKPKSQPQSDYSDFKCQSCEINDVPICFVCKSTVSPKGNIDKRQKCQVAHCHKFYHLECLEHWPQTQFASGEPSRNNKKIDEHFEAITCPRHVCHTCVCDDPRGCKTRFSGDKLARCVRCPATYHSFTKCLPAGTQILSASHIVCPRHYNHRPGKVPCHVNTGWCFICALGGTLICCEYCPTSFHADCLNIEPPEGGYMCEDCETGRLPLYGEMVWVKLGHYRWWPGIILHPSMIPKNIMAVKHSLGEFVVQFFGQYDHYWVNRGRVFPFQEGDSGRLSGQKSKIDEAFTIAMDHAQRAFEILKNVEPNDEESQDIASSLLPPHYVKLKVNKPCGSLYGKKVDIEESSLTQCECNPDEEEPCGPYSHCLNRMLLTECGPTCRAGERCQNRAFEKRQYPKLVPYRTPHRGWGLKTLEEVKAGQFVIEYVGELIDEGEFQRRMRRKHEMRDENYYFLTLDKERMIDAGPKGNLARFMNHCCEPNCETQKWTVLGDIRVGLFAIHDIPANTEVTFNYNLECAGIEKKQCMCGAKRCSGFMGAKPKQDDPQPKKTKIPAKRTYKKRKNTIESPSTSKNKPKRPVGRPAKPRELTEIEKDLLIIKNATNGISSDSEGSRLSSLESEKKDAKALKRKRVSFSTEEIIIYNGISSPSVKKLKLDDEKVSEVGD